MDELEEKALRGGLCSYASSPGKKVEDMTPKEMWDEFFSHYIKVSRYSHDPRMSDLITRFAKVIARLEDFERRNALVTEAFEEAKDE